jgi:hypothetical protein
MAEANEPVPPLGLEEFQELVREIERLCRVGGQFSNAAANTACPYLIFQASTAFNKAMMSLVGFLRFIPPSQFYARSILEIIDISSASVLARQVLEDLLAFFYLAQPDLCPEQKEIRELVWKYHGFCEAIEASRLAFPSEQDSTESERRAKQMLAKIEVHPLFEVKSSTAKGRIRKGQVGILLHEEEILQIRGINPDYYNLPRKVLSNLAHFSSLSVSIVNATNRNWHQSWTQFILPAYHVVRFVVEGLAVFTELFPQVGTLASAEDKLFIDQYRNSLRRGRSL